MTCYKQRVIALPLRMYVGVHLRCGSHNSLFSRRPESPDDTIYDFRVACKNIVGGYPLLYAQPLYISL
jgi:hypothetical protein